MLLLDFCTIWMNHDLLSQFGVFVRVFLDQEGTSSLPYLIERFCGQDINPVMCNVVRCYNLPSSQNEASLVKSAINK